MVFFRKSLSTVSIQHKDYTTAPTLPSETGHLTRCAMLQPKPCHKPIDLKLVKV